MWHRWALSRRGVPLLLLAQRLQPYAIEAATLCDRGCNPMRSRCEGEVLLVSWPVPGVWDKHAVVRMALPGQRVCALRCSPSSQPPPWPWPWP